MPPRVALIIGYAFVWWLFQRDRNWRKLPSLALWIPGLWVAILSSRQPSFWIGGGEGSNLEGSPINIIFNGSLFALSILVLQRRGVNWSAFVSHNKALIAIYGYFFLSPLWSQFPLPSFKRVIQDFGCVIIALVILTERNPAEALRIVFVRVAYVLFPLSVIFIRWFPEIGRTVSTVSGAHMVSGVAGHKNSLGQLVLVLGLILVWDIIESRNEGPQPRTKIQKWARLSCLAIGVYLLIISNSATSLVCFLFGIGMLFAWRRLAAMKNAKRLILIAGCVTLISFGADKLFGISDAILTALGRDSSLTGRTDIWRVIHEKNTHGLLGAGFRGFWESREGESVYLELGTNRLLTAHNGYLEAYLNGGIVAIFLLGILLLSGAARALETLFHERSLGRVSLMFWLIAVIYNNTESNFFILEPLWFVLLVVMIDSRRLIPVHATPSVAGSLPEVAADSSASQTKGNRKPWNQSPSLWLQDERKEGRKRPWQTHLNLAATN